VWTAPIKLPSSPVRYPLDRGYHSLCWIIIREVVTSVLSSFREDGFLGRSGHFGVTRALSIPGSSKRAPDRGCVPPTSTRCKRSVTCAHEYNVLLISRSLQVGIQSSTDSSRTPQCPEKNTTRRARRSFRGTLIPHLAALERAAYRPRGAAQVIDRVDPL
jgi:hypothetical protein